ncbi:MAG TPA: hypothetical protein VF730_14330 [Terracidiphilus sp.]
MGEAVRRFNILAFAGFFALVSLAVVSPASAQAGHFEILLNGKQIGTADCSFAAVAEGYNTTSVVHVVMQGLDYSLSKTEQLSSANELEHALLNAVVNGQAVTIIAGPASGQLVLDISANGRKTTSRLPAHAATAMLPDFDPGALETLLALAVEHNNRDLWVIIPKKEGSVEPVQLATYADQQGTLDGNAVAVHHLVATTAGAKIDLFSGPENRLVQAEFSQQGFAFIRKGFVLNPSPQAAAPPAS